MPAPQQIGSANDSGVSIYYVPPGEQPPNAFANFWSNFLATRSPWARQVFTARLAAMDPTAQYAALGELAKAREGLLRTQAEMEQAVMKDQTTRDVESSQFARGIYSADTQAYAAELGASSRVTAARLDLQGDMIEAGTLDEDARQVLGEYKTRMEAGQRDLQQAMQDGDSTRAQAAVQAMRQATAFARQAAGNLPPLQQDALARQVQGLPLIVSDPEVQAEIRGMSGEAFGRPAELRVPDTGYGGRRPTMPTTGSPAAGIVSRIYGSASPAPPAGGGAPSGSASSFSTSGSGPSPERRTASPAAAPASGGVAPPPVAGPPPPPPAGGGSSRVPFELSTMQSVRDEMARLDAREGQVRAMAADPQAALGGLFDPLPGAGGGGPRRRHTREPRTPRTMAERIRGGRGKGTPPQSDLEHSVQNAQIGGNTGSTEFVQQVKAPEGATKPEAGTGKRTGTKAKPTPADIAKGLRPPVGGGAGDVKDAERREGAAPPLSRGGGMGDVKEAERGEGSSPPAPAAKPAPKSDDRGLYERGFDAVAGAAGAAGSFAAQQLEEAKRPRGASPEYTAEVKREMEDPNTSRLRKHVQQIDNVFSHPLEAGRLTAKMIADRTWTPAINQGEADDAADRARSATETAARWTNKAAEADARGRIGNEQAASDAMGRAREVNEGAEAAVRQGDSAKAQGQAAADRARGATLQAAASTNKQAQIDEARSMYGSVVASDAAEEQRRRARDVAAGQYTARKNTEVAEQQTAEGSRVGRDAGAREQEAAVDTALGASAAAASASNAAARSTAAAATRGATRAAENSSARAQGVSNAGAEAAAEQRRQAARAAASAGFRGAQNIAEPASDIAARDSNEAATTRRNVATGARIAESATNEAARRSNTAADAAQVYESTSDASLAGAAAAEEQRRRARELAARIAAARTAAR